MTGRFWRATTAVAVLAMAGTGCGRDPDTLLLHEAGGRLASFVDLYPLELGDHAGFDRLDAMAAGSGADVLRLYEDLARVSPDSRLVLIRAGVAGMGDGTPKGRAVAEGVLTKLAAAGPTDADGSYLALLVGRARLAGSDGILRIDGSNADAARTLVAQAADFAAKYADWTGPRRASATMVTALGQEVATAVARFDQGMPPVPPPAAAPAGGDPEDDEEAPGE